MDYQARLNDILEKVRKGGVYDVMPEYERQSDYLDTDEAQEVITALFLESVGKNEEAEKYMVRYWKSKLEAKQDGIKVGRNEMRRDIRRKWETNQEDGE